MSWLLAAQRAAAGGALVGRLARAAAATPFAASHLPAAACALRPGLVASDAGPWAAWPLAARHLAGASGGGGGEEPPPPRTPADAKPTTSADRKADGPPGPAPAAGGPEAAPGPGAAGAGARGAGGADPDADYVHAHFNNNDRMRSMQPLLEQAERTKGFSGLQDDAGGWAYLYDSPLARMAASVLWPLRGALRSTLMAGVLARLHGVGESMVREHVEYSFDAQEFLDGVREAVPAFYAALAANDAAALRAMASSAAVDAVARGAARLQARQGLVVERADAAVEGVELAGVNLWGPASVGGFDPSWLAEVTPDTSKSWLVVSVTLDVRLDVGYRLVGVPGAAGPGGPDLQASRVVRRFGSWLFARGPLPRGAVSTLQSRWRLLAWW